MHPDKRRVVMWRRELLPGSETFVRSQLNGLTKWRGSALGALKVSSPVAAISDEVLFAGSRFDRLRLKVFTLSRYSYALQRRLRQLKPDVVHAHFAMDGILIAPLCSLLKIPFVVSVYGVDVTAMAARSGVRGWAYRKRLASMFKKCAKVLAVSEHLAEAAIQLGAPADKVVVHRLGIELPETTARDEGAWEWDVLVVGRLVEKKGVDDLIRAAALVNSRYNRSIRLAVVGDGPLRHSLEESARGLGVSVNFLGGQSPKNVEDIMRRSRILAVPSKIASNGDREGLPMILLEGAARSLPIVATRHSGIPEFVTHGITGLLSDEGDVYSLAQNVEQLLKDANYGASLASGALQRVTNEYNIRVQMQLLENIYDEALRPG